MKLLTILSIFLIISGCDGANNTKNNAPMIQGADIIENIGEPDDFIIVATDPQLDMADLFVTQFQPFDSDVPYAGPDIIALPTQTKSTMTYNLAKCIDITASADDRRIEFQIVDANNHVSNVFIQGTNPLW